MQLPNVDPFEGYAVTASVIDLGAGDGPLPLLAFEPRTGSATLDHLGHMGWPLWFMKRPPAVDPRWAAMFDNQAGTLRLIGRFNEAGDRIEQTLFVAEPEQSMPADVWRLLRNRRKVLLCGLLQGVAGGPTPENLQVIAQSPRIGLRAVVADTLFDQPDSTSLHDRVRATLAAIDIQATGLDPARLREIAQDPTDLTDDELNRLARAAHLPAQWLRTGEMPAATT